MKVKDLIKRLEQCDSELEISFYNLQHFDDVRELRWEQVKPYLDKFSLEEKELESIQEVDNRLEITIENRWSGMGWRGCLY